MFTGLVEKIGTIVNLDKQVDEQTNDLKGIALTIGDAAEILGDCHDGDSISVNGACLTVTSFDPSKGQFVVYIALETIRRTNLGELELGSKVNLERALAVGARYGGHAVQGHVDGIATISNIEQDGSAINYDFTLPEQATIVQENNNEEGNEEEDLMSCIVTKGFITLDGVSLTITHVDDKTRTFGVMLIPHTQTKVILASKKVGDKVNVEADVLAKFVIKSTSSARVQGTIERMVAKAIQKQLNQ